MTKIKKVSRSIEWAKVLLQMTEKDIDNLKSKGVKVIYAYSYFGQDGDEIAVRFFKDIVPNILLNKHFGEKAIGAKLFGDVCEIVL